MMKYKGFYGHAEYKEEDKIIYGRVINTNDVISFQSENAKDIEKEFHESVDAYVEFCEKFGKKPDKEYSGKFIVRISPEKHIQAVAGAKKMKMSLNAFVEKALEDEIHLVGV